VSVNWIRSLRPSTVFVDVCPRDTHTPHGLSCFIWIGPIAAVEEVLRGVLRKVHERARRGVRPGALRQPVGQESGLRGREGWLDAVRREKGVEYPAGFLVFRIRKQLGIVCFTPHIGEAGAGGPKKVFSNNFGIVCTP